MPDSTNPSNPGKKVSCMEMLQHILDGDATAEQQQHFKDHLDECMPCFKTYNLEVALKTLIKTKCNGNGAPQELIERIKSQISQNMPR
ncbi:MAG: mycothiol system anti-sigma-R factor [Cyclobacteriaceae bacterium]|nr:mycothiol system anti-sigma-R factor [Cyclobacteriaceae bacterium]